MLIPNSETKDGILEVCIFVLIPHSIGHTIIKVSDYVRLTSDDKSQKGWVSSETYAFICHILPLIDRLRPNLGQLRYILRFMAQIQ